MDDLISRAAAIEAIKEDKIDLTNPNVVATFKATGDFEKVETQVMTCDRHIKILKDLPFARQWIPVTERLPYAGEYGGSDTVLTTCGYRDVEDASVRWIRLLYFNGGNWYYPTGETYDAKVYAWMPLPEVWKGEQNE